MYKNCKIQQSSDRQWQIARCLIPLMQRQSYRSISVSDLCREAQISRRTFYRYYDNLDDVFQLMIDHMFVEYEAFAVPFQSSRNGSSQQDMEKFFAFWEHKRDWLDALARSSMFGTLVSRIIQNSYAGLLDIHWPRELPPEEMQIVSSYVLSGLFAMLETWYLQGFAQTVPQIAAIAVELMTQPLYPARL